MRYFFIFLTGIIILTASCSKKVAYKEDARYFYTVDSYKHFPITYKPKYRYIKTK